FQVGVRRRGVEVVVQLLDILAVVGLAVGQAEEAFLEDRVTAVPERQRQTQPLFLVADAGDTVLAPAVSPAARLVVGKAIPGVAARTVIVAHRSPLTFAEVRPPAAPRLPAKAVLFKAQFLRIRLVVGSHGWFPPRSQTPVWERTSAKLCFAAFGSVESSVC